MGHCCSKSVSVSFVKDDDNTVVAAAPTTTTTATAAGRSKSPIPAAQSSGNGTTPVHSFSASPWQSPYPAGVAPSPAMTPRRMFKWPFPPPSPAKPIMSAILKRQGASKPKEGPIPEDERGGVERQLDKSFGYPKNFAARYELGKEVGRGHFGHTCWAKVKKGELKNQPVAVKIISKAKNGDRGIAPCGVQRIKKFDWVRMCS